MISKRKEAGERFRPGGTLDFLEQEEKSTEANESNECCRKKGLLQL